MPAAVYHKLNFATLEPTSMCLQLADQSVRCPFGIAENIPVKIREFFVPIDFVVLDMSPDSKVSLILGRPFLSTSNTHIDVEKGEIKFTINGQEEQFAFKPKPKLNSTVKMVCQDKEDIAESSSHHRSQTLRKNKIYLESSSEDFKKFEPLPKGKSVVI
jgi:hypothetical protein